ncbi:MAG: rod shape-determining protein MreD [Deltaproteobacteria bacterium]|nr:rod shape-determining protein MreD [Deltaproteobacteria bacterium]
MKELLLFLPLSIVFLAIKSTLFVSLPLPDLPLIIIFYMGYRRASLEGVLLSFALGYLDDAFNGSIIGSTSFALVTIFLAVFLLSKKVQFSTPALRAGGVGAAAIIKGLLSYSVLRFTNVDVYFFTQVILHAVVTGVFASPIIIGLQKLNSYVSPHTFKDNEN